MGKSFMTLQLGDWVLRTGANGEQHYAQVIKVNDDTIDLEPGLGVFDLGGRQIGGDARIVPAPDYDPDIEEKRRGDNLLNRGVADFPDW